MEMTISLFARLLCPHFVVTAALCGGKQNIFIKTRV
jgi:hypothetical protein